MLNQKTNEDEDLTKFHRVRLRTQGQGFFPPSISIDPALQRDMSDVNREYELGIRDPNPTTF